eukprot:scaffold140026_cov22-Tisochrysis_lutea.AAC.4
MLLSALALFVAQAISAQRGVKRNVMSVMEIEFRSRKEMVQGIGSFDVAVHVTMTFGRCICHSDIWT